MPEKLYPDASPDPRAKKSPGLVHLCYGQGAGKTSRAVGLAVRAAGAGLKVAWVQFMKGPGSSEAKVLKSLGNLEYFCPGPHPFIMEDGPAPVHLEHAASALARAKDEAARVQVMICDELLNAVLFGLVTVEQALALMNACRGRCELLLTGADARSELIEAADYVTRLVQVKHPYYRGIPARKGVEF